MDGEISSSRKTRSTRKDQPKSASIRVCLYYRQEELAVKVTKAEGGYLLSGGPEAWLAPNVPFAAGLPLHAPCRRPEMGLFSGSIPPWFVLSHNMSMINTTSNWLCSDAFPSPPDPFFRFHCLPGSILSPLAPRPTPHASRP